MRPRCGLALPRRHAGRLAWLVAAAASRQDSYMSLLAARVEELRRDREHGASWMARRTVETLLEVAEEPCETCEALVDQLVEAGRKLAESRPGVGAIAGAAGRLLATANAHRYLDLEELRRLIAEEANALVDRRRRAAASIAIQLRGSLEDAVVATHSASATVREALLRTSPRSFGARGSSSSSSRTWTRRRPSRTRRCSSSAPTRCSGMGRCATRSERPRSRRPRPLAACRRSSPPRPSSSRRSRRPTRRSLALPSARSSS